MDKLQVLLVEDDAHISNMEQELLTGNGYGVRAAYSGTEALLLLSLQRFDLVLLDLMPVSYTHLLRCVRRQGGTQTRRL